MPVNKKLVVLVSLVLLSGLISAHKAYPQAQEKKIEFWERQFLLRQLLTTTAESAFTGESELSEVQKDQLKKIAEEYRRDGQAAQIEIQKRLIEVNSPSKSESEKTKGNREIVELRNEKFDQIAKDAVEKMEDVLLPHQMRRIKQIAVQRELINRTKGDGFMILAALSDRLGLSSDQEEKLLEKIEKTSEEYSQELQKLRDRHNKKVVDSLPLSAREKLKEIIGEFHYKK